MPSGFQQDLNQLQPVFYRVVITMSNTTYYPTTTSSNDSGGVTPTSADSFATGPATIAISKSRARGNMRFRNVINALTGLADCQVMDITITEATVDAQATSLAFTVKFDRDGFIPVTGTAIDGSTAITTTAIALKNEIAKAIRLSTTATARTPVALEDGQTTVTATHTGATATQTYGTVAVSLIDETTLLD